MPPSVLDMVVGTPPSPFKVLGLTQAVCASFGTLLESLQATQSSMDVERLSATIVPAGHCLQFFNDFSSEYCPASHPRLWDCQKKRSGKGKR